MRFPFVTRAHHEAVVTAMTKQLEGLAKLLYPNGVPEEFQLLLGIQIEAKPQDQPEPEKELSDDEKYIAKIKAEQEADKRHLEYLRRLYPSQLGKAVSDYMAKYTYQAAVAASSPAKAVFAKAEAEALSQFPDA